ncbi:MAG: GNAT family N-acetyltransferase [Synergistaceae bacterium]|nr:GNAT family N-acetyltransferase [Synergistaceae bacterium]
MDIRTKILTDQDEIAEVIGICAEAFHDQRCNDPAVIQEFSEKFSVRACFVAACTEDEVVGFAAFYCNDTVNFTAFISMIVVRSIYHLRGGGLRFSARLRKFAGITE